MERREKTEFLLEQMRFLIMVAREKDAEKGVEGKQDAVSGGEADWIKVRVAGRKVNESFLAQKENEVNLKEIVDSYVLNPNFIGPQTEILRYDDSICPESQSVP